MTLPQVRTTGKHLRDVTDDAMKRLQSANNPPVLFVRGGEMVRLKADEHKHPVVQKVNEAILCNRLARVADFVTKSNRGFHPVNPPNYVVKDILAMASWPFPALDGIVEVPVLRRDGSILHHEGYDSKTGLYHWPAEGLVVPQIPEIPKTEHIKAALSLLTDVIGDFPYDTPASKANLIALLLTPILRPAIDGKVPLALLDAPQQGTGKSLLAEVVGVIATGRPGSVMTAPGSEDEWRKRITSTLAEGATVITIDNLEGTLSSAQLASALTAPTWKDRILGLSQNIELPQRATWMATGNNIRLGGDMQRRCYWIRIDAKMDKPWLREDFKISDLLPWVERNRGKLLAALLTLSRAWFAAGQPKGNAPKIGSFESWSRILGGVLAYIGVEQFLGNLTSLYDSADEEAAEWEAFLDALLHEYGEKPFTTAQLAEDLKTTPALSENLPSDLAEVWAKRDDQKVSIARRLGRAFSNRESRCAGKFRIEKHKARNRAGQEWRVLCREMETPAALQQAA